MPLLQAPRLLDIQQAYPDLRLTGLFVVRYDNEVEEAFACTDAAHAGKEIRFCDWRIVLVSTQSALGRGLSRSEAGQSVEIDLPMYTFAGRVVSVNGSPLMTPEMCRAWDEAVTAEIEAQRQREQAERERRMARAREEETVRQLKERRTLRDGVGETERKKRKKGK